jgi:flagellar protein FlgJ
VPSIAGQADSAPAGADAQSPAKQMAVPDGKVSMNGLPNALALALQPGSTTAGTATPAAGQTTNQAPNRMPQALSVAVSRTSSQPEQVQGVGAGPLAASRSSFVDRLWPHAQQAESVTGVPAAFVVGQAALESGWGRGEIRHPDGRSAHNLFGIKATGDWQGQTVDVRTTEYENGRRVSRVETFRAYASYGDAFQDWVGLMTRLPRYAGVLTGASSPEQFAHGLQQAGYATDPNYGNKLQKVIQQTIAIQQARKG